MTEAANRAVLEGRGLPLRGDDCDTDRIIPARFLLAVTFDGLGAQVFADDRARARAEHRVHPFDDERHRGASVLVVNRNFGCGSSREHAPQALQRAGIHAIVGESFAEIFFANCVALGIPCLTVSGRAATDLLDACEADPSALFRVDVRGSMVSVGDLRYPASMPEGPRRLLVEGRWDTTAELLRAGEEIDAAAERIPYLRGFERSGSGAQG